MQTVLITVRKGVANVDYAPPDCQVIIVDFDEGELSDLIPEIAASELPTDVKREIISEIDN